MHSLRTLKGSISFSYLDICIPGSQFWFKCMNQTMHFGSPPRVWMEDPGEFTTLVVLLDAFGYVNDFALMGKCGYWERKRERGLNVRC